MSNETVSEELIKIMSMLNTDSTTNKVTLIMTCVTTIIVTLKPLFYHWVDAKYGRNGVRRNEDGEPIQERELPLDNNEPQINNSTASTANIPIINASSTNNNAGVINIYTHSPAAQQPEKPNKYEERSFGASESSSSPTDANDSQNL